MGDNGVFTDNPASDRVWVSSRYAGASRNGVDNYSATGLSKSHVASARPTSSAPRDAGRGEARRIARGLSEHGFLVDADDFVFAYRGFAYERKGANGWIRCYKPGNLTPNDIRLILGAMMISARDIGLRRLAFMSECRSIRRIGERLGFRQVSDAWILTL